MTFALELNLHEVLDVMHGLRIGKQIVHNIRSLFFFLPFLQCGYASTRLQGMAYTPYTEYTLVYCQRNPIRLPVPTNTRVGCLISQYTKLRKK